MSVKSSVTVPAGSVSILERYDADLRSAKGRRSPFHRCGPRRRSSASELDLIARRAIVTNRNRRVCRAANGQQTGSKRLKSAWLNHAGAGGGRPEKPHE